MTFRIIIEDQGQLPWVLPYSDEFNDNRQRHKHFAHALTHAMKSMGELAAFVERLDHQNMIPPQMAVDVAESLADLVICATRMAEVVGFMKPIDLARAVKERLESKNGVKL